MGNRTQQPKVIMDASSLIILTKVEGIDTCYKVYGLIGVVEAVFNEVVKKGKEKGKPDAFLIESKVNSGKIVRIQLTSQQKVFAQSLHTPLSPYGIGECETITYAKEEGILLIIEDRKGKTLAKLHGVPYTIIQLFPLEGYIKKKIIYEECIHLLEKIAIFMNTDLAVLNGLKMAVEELRRARKEGGDSK